VASDKDVLKRLSELNRQYSSVRVPEQSKLGKIINEIPQKVLNTKERPFTPVIRKVQSSAPKKFVPYIKNKEVQNLDDANQNDDQQNTSSSDSMDEKVKRILKPHNKDVNYWSK
jgi:hypothetical protein